MSDLTNQINELFDGPQQPKQEPVVEEIIEEVQPHRNGLLNLQRTEHEL